MNKLLSIILLSLLISCGTTKISKNEFKYWTLVGIGEVHITEDQLKITESKKSKGVVFISQKKLPENYHLSFEVKPNQYKGVLVFLTNISDKETSEMPTFPKNYNGAWGFWKSKSSKIKSYAYAVHTTFHQPYAFLRKNPGFKELQKVRDTFNDQNWHRVEITKNKGHLRLMIDSKALLETTDPEPLPPGFFGLRLRGPGNGSFNAKYRHMTLKKI